MIRSGWNKILAEREWLPVALLLCVGFALRLFDLGALPTGLNQDEASAGYEAWALLHYGMDRAGNSWPVLFVSWGSGQNVLMSYLAMPFVALLGLTAQAVRLPNALFGCLTLPVFWLLARRNGGRAFGVCALLLLALNPWHIMMSRWALESNLFPAFLLGGVYLTALARRHPSALIGAAACFGLSLYAYGTAFFFLPPFLICAVIWLRRELRAGSFCCALAVFVVLALPIGLCQLRNLLGLPGVTVLGVTLPALTQSRQAATSVLGGGGLRAACDNFRTVLRILWYQSDGLAFNALGLSKGGLFYFFGLPTALVGLAVALGKRKDRICERPMVIALGCALLCAFFIDGNINRLNMLWLPLIYFSALGCFTLLHRSGIAAALGGIVLAVCCCLFLRDYRGEFGGEGNVNFFPGLGQAVEYACAAEGQDIYVSNYVNQPYMFALFYSQTPPEEFCATVHYENENAAFRQVTSFGAFRFGNGGGADGTLNILPVWEAEGRPVQARFGMYCVCA